jgi:hypothetical protein
MPTPIKTLELGGTTFSVGPIKAIKSFTLQPRIFPLIAEVISSIAAMLRAAPSEEETADAGETRAEAAAVLSDLERQKARMSIGALGRAAQRLQIDTVDVDGIVPIVGRVCAQLPPDELEQILRILLSNTFANGERLFSEQHERGKPDPFDKVMQGRTLDTWRLVWEALRVVYADFFDRLGGKLASGKAATSEASPT